MCWQGPLLIHTFLVIVGVVGNVLCFLLHRQLFVVLIVLWFIFHVPSSSYSIKNVQQSISRKPKNLDRHTDGRTDDLTPRIGICLCSINCSISHNLIVYWLQKLIDCIDLNSFHANRTIHCYSLTQIAPSCRTRVCW